MTKEIEAPITTNNFEAECPLLNYNFRIKRVTSKTVTIKTPVQEAYTLQNERLNGYHVAHDAVNKVCKGCTHHDNLESGLVLNVSSGMCDPTVPLIQSNTEAVIVAHIGKVKAKNKNSLVYVIKKLFGATSD